MKAKYTLEINAPQLDMLLSALSDMERQGWYYGRKDQFDKRLEKLIKLLENHQTNQEPYQPEKSDFHA